MYNAPLYSRPIIVNYSSQVTKINITMAAKRLPPSNGIECYVHLVENIRNSQSTGRPWFNTFVQTKSESILRIPSYTSETQWQQLRNYAQTKDPIRIRELGKLNDGTICLNKSTTFTLLQSVDFAYVREDPVTSSIRPDSEFVSLVEVERMRTNETAFREISVQGVVTFGQDDMEEIRKKDGTTGYIKYDCVIEGDGCLVQLRMWETVFKNVTSGQNYSIKNVIPMNIRETFCLSTNFRTNVEQLANDPKFKTKSASVLQTLSCIVSVTVDRFRCCRPVKMSYTCLSCTLPISTNTTVAPMFLKCAGTDCGANNLVKLMQFTCQSEVAFLHNKEQVWAKLPGKVLEKYVDIKNTTSENLDLLIATMTEIELRLNEKSMKIIDMPKCKVETNLPGTTATVATPSDSEVTKTEN